MTLRKEHGWTLLAVALATLATLAWAPVATAQQDEVFVDPDSPTGLEYDIPLERARRQASGPAAAPRSSRSAAGTRFGEGITSPTTSPSTTPRDREAYAARRSDSPDRRRSQRRNARDPFTPAVEASIRRPGAPGGGAGETLLVAGGGALLVALGLGAGLALRRVRRQ